MKVIRNIRPSFIDGRGAITMVLDENIAIKSILLITCKAGSIRANHYHKKDSHYAYMLSGKMEYTEKSLRGKNNKAKSTIIKAGDMVYTPPQAIHAMRFLKKSVFLALATRSRHQQDYEKDTIRVKLI